MGGGNKAPQKEYDLDMTAIGVKHPFPTVAIPSWAGVLHGSLNDDVPGQQRHLPPHVHSVSDLPIVRVFGKHCVGDKRLINIFSILMYICMYENFGLCMCVCICTCMCACLYTRMHACVYVHLSVCLWMHVCMVAWIYVYACTDAFVYLCVRVCTHTYIQTCMHDAYMYAVSMLGVYLCSPNFIPSMLPFVCNNVELADFPRITFSFQQRGIYSCRMTEGTRDKETEADLVAKTKTETEMGPTHKAL